MDFSNKNIDFPSIAVNSKSVYDYFTNRVATDIKNIENLKQNQFHNYAEKHNKSIDELLKLYDAGYNEGIKQAIKTIKERNIISPKGGELYLFEIASTYNLCSKYYNSTIALHFKKFILIEYDPEIIKSIGRIVGEFYYSWLKVLQNHRVFEPHFKTVIEKIKNNFLNKPAFPVHGVKYAEFPDSMQFAKDTFVTLKRMNEIISKRLDQLSNGTLDNLNMNRIFRYDILKDFKKQLSDFLQEITNNTNNGIFEKYISFYQQINSELNNSVELFSSKAKPYHNFDMSFIYEFHLYNKNWFIIVLDYLTQTNETFQGITKFDKQLIGFKCDLDPVVVEKIFHAMINHKPNPQIEDDLSKFLAIFSKTPTSVTKPLTWLIKAQTGSRGNQMKLYFFLEKMLQQQPTSEDKRKAAKLFVDEKGEFFNPKMKKPKDEERHMYDEFENLIKINS